MIFPKGFHFGVADADLQVISEDKCLALENSEPSMWLAFANQTNKCFNSDSPALGIDRYSKWPEDINFLKKLGVQGYRTSISMCRTIRRSGEINPQAIQWYQNYLRTIKNLGISVAATLYHWELPEYLEQQGGWTSRATVDVFLRHVEVTISELGEYLDSVIILNEPWCSSILSYYLGIHAPGHQDLREALLAAHHLLLAQAEAVKIIKGICPKLHLSTALNFETAYSASTKAEDLQAAKTSDGYFNRWFLDPIFKGSYPADMLEIYGDKFSTALAKEAKNLQINQALDSLGINFYLGRVVKHNPKEDLKFSYIWNPAGLVNDLGWPICIPPHYPSGLADGLQQIYYSYKDFGLKSIYISENGTAIYNSPSEQTAPVPDARRIAYLQAHLAQVQTAILRGVPVTGYYAWTLMDNYEWAEGYRDESRFGLIYVNRETLERIPKESFYWYQKLIEQNS